MVTCRWCRTADSRPVRDRYEFSGSARLAAGVSVTAAVIRSPRCRTRQPPRHMQPCWFGEAGAATHCSVKRSLWQRPLAPIW